MYNKGGFLMKTYLKILKNTLCQIIWYLIIRYLIEPYLFYFVPFPIIQHFLKNILYNYIYCPIFNFLFDKTIELISYLYSTIKDELHYISKRLY